MDKTHYWGGSDIHCANRQPCVPIRRVSQRSHRQERLLQDVLLALDAAWGCKERFGCRQVTWNGTRTTMERRRRSTFVCESTLPWSTCSGNDSSLSFQALPIHAPWTNVQSRLRRAAEITFQRNQTFEQRGSHLSNAGSYGRPRILLWLLLRQRVYSC